MSQQLAVYEDIIIRDAQAQAALGRLSTGVGKISTAIQGIKGKLAGAGGIAAAGAGLAGVFALGETIRGTEALYARIARIKSVTGVAADEAHGMVDAFEMTGSGAIAESTITRLARLGQLAKGGSKQASELRATLARVGVDMKGGASESLLSLSNAVQRGKIGVAGLSKVFNVPLAQAADLMSTLRQGPAHLKSIMDETKRGADVVDEAALDNFESMMQARREMNDAWEGLVGTLYKTLIPLATRFVNVFKNGLDRIQPVAESIGKVLSEHMGLVVVAAKAYLGYLVAAKAVGVFTNGQQTLGGLLGSRFSGVLQGPWKQAAATPWRDNLGSGFAGMANAAMIRGQFAGRGGRLAGAGQGIAQALGSWSPTLGRLAASTVSMRALGAVVTRLGVAGLAVGVAVKGFQILKNDIGGHRTRIAAVLGDIAAKFQGIGKAISPVLNLMGKVFGEALMIVARYWLYVIEYWLKAVNGFLRIVKAIAYFVADMVTTAPWNWSRSMFARAWERAGEGLAESTEKAGAKKTKKTPNGTPDGVYQDFRGSKFDITQNFAEGFDPGRVSVAFTEKIAEMGERRLQSGFAPVFGIRGMR